jgi:hypothetical protein
MGRLHDRLDAVDQDNLVAPVELVRLDCAKFSGTMIGVRTRRRKESVI